MAGVMLANAVRAVAHLRDRTYRAGTVAALHRRQARDLLRVLFPHGPAMEEECLEEPYAQAIGVSLAGIGDACTFVAQIVDTVFIHNR